MFLLEFVEPRKDIANAAGAAHGNLLLFFLAQVSVHRRSRCLSAARRTQEENRACSQSNFRGPAKQ